jgi:hypothetical protein
LRNSRARQTSCDIRREIKCRGESLSNPTSALAKSDTLQSFRANQNIAKHLVEHNLAIVQHVAHMIGKFHTSFNAIFRQSTIISLEGHCL